MTGALFKGLKSVPTGPDSAEGACEEKTCYYKNKKITKTNLWRSKAKPNHTAVSYNPNRIRRANTACTGSPHDRHQTGVPTRGSMFRGMPPIK